MELVPSDLIDSQIVSSVGLLVLSRIGSRTFVDLAFLSADQENVRIEGREVET